jgi:putative glycosyltransferase (TIGR04348 family)
MKIMLVCPAPPGSRSGNRVTAMRWARIFRYLGHRAVIAHEYAGERCDLLVALHARRSRAAIFRYRKLWSGRPLVVALTGTDLYRDIRTHSAARRALELADRLVLLQPCGLEELPPRFRPKARVIYQSARPVQAPPRTAGRFFNVCVLGHLRRVKDPFRTALALVLLPAESRIRVTHAGRALEAGYAARARRLERRESRYRWLGEVPRWWARRILARSDLLVLSSRMEGGANVISEAVVSGVPVLASRISGSVGLLGARYPGFFPVGDTQALARLLRRAETDAPFYEDLSNWCARLAPLFDPAREQSTWQQLLDELAAGEQRGDHDADQDEALGRSAGAG